MFDAKFWKNRKIFITGHTGFKGAWLCMLLNYLGADIHGYSLEPPTSPSLFELCGIDTFVKTKIADVRDLPRLCENLREASPEVVIHMAAQPLVRRAYKDPVGTFETNIMGTVNVLEAVRTCPGVRAAVVVTSDKCYENREWIWSYRENDRLGGYDPYSSSKACAELVTASYINSFFNLGEYEKHGIAVATARAGNVIGGGDWATDRIIPDCVRAIVAGEKIVIRNPGAIRPWQHVLEPLAGYLSLAQKLCETGPGFSGAWNFGPADSDSKTVEWLVAKLCEKYGETAGYLAGKDFCASHEAGVLKLDSSKAKKLLGWRQVWDAALAVDMVVNWVRAHSQGEDHLRTSRAQIEAYLLEEAVK